MKKIYFAGNFNKIKNEELSLEKMLANDYRSRLLGSSKLLTHYQKNFIVDNKFIYSGPFYCEQASNGDYISTDCNVVIDAEYEAINKADKLVVVFNDNFSVGTVVELGWALNLDIQTSKQSVLRHSI